MRSASLFIRFPRCAALIFRHGPLSNAARAAATALSTSAASASATCVITSPVEGLLVGKVFPEAASTHFPLIKSFVADTFTLGSITVVAVAMVVPPSPILIPMPLLSPLAAASGPLVQSFCRARSLGRPLLRGPPAYTPAPPESINPINRRWVSLEFQPIDVGF